MRAYRSPLRLFVFGMIGVTLVLASVDIMFGHWLSTPPDENNGVLTTRGQAQQRGDIIWGAAMVGMGTLLVGGAVVELVRRRAVVEVRQDAMVVAIGPHESDVAIPWTNIRAVGSDTAIDPYDGSEREFLVIDVYDHDGLPDAPIGAEWSGLELRVDAHDWSKRVTEVALSAQGALGHHRRVEEIKQMGPPSVTWETTTEDEAVLEEPAAVVVDDSGGEADSGEEDEAG